MVAITALAVISGHTIIPSGSIAHAETVWQQLGEDIDGSTASDWFGTSVAISGDGTTIAVSGAADNSIPNGPGVVRVYRYASGSWVQFGSDISGDETFGVALSLNNDGTVLAVGEPGFYGDDGSGGFLANVGAVFVYRYSAGWNLDSANDVFDGEAGDAGLYGSSVSISGDGSRLAIGAPNNEQGGNQKAGLVQVWENSGSGWAKVGGDITGGANSRTGKSVALSRDGLTLAYGQPGWSGTTCGGTSEVAVVTFNGTFWGGEAFENEVDDDCLGSSIALNGDGTVLAAGAPSNDGNGTNSGHVMVWTKDPDDGWVRMGSDIDGSDSSNRFGSSVSLDDTGNVLSVGAPYGNYAATYQFNASTQSWSIFGDRLDGEARNDYFGYSVALSRDGDRLVVGGPGNDGVASSAGHARVFESFVSAAEAQNSVAETEVGQPGIFLTVMGGVGAKVSGVQVQYGADRIRNNSPYSLELVDLETQFRRVLSAGSATTGSFDDTVSLGALAEGSYRLRLWAYDVSGQLLRLGNTLVISGGTISSITPERLQPSVY